MKLHAALSFALALFSGAEAMAANLAYVVIPGVPGNSRSDRYTSSIEASSVSVSVVNRLCTGFTIVKSLDPATAPLTNAAVQGTVYPLVTVYLVNVGGQTDQQYATYSLLNSPVTSITSQSTTGSTINETVTFAPASVGVVYREQRFDGSFGPEVSYTLNCSKVK